MSRIYLAGPMSGIPDLNYPAFFAAEERWHAAGWEVTNPARLWPADPGLTRQTCLKKDLPALIACDGIAMLAGWDKSIGARAELTVARMVGLTEYDAVTMAALVPETVCQEADRLVATDRQSVYGHPFDDFSKTGRLWAVVLGLPEVTPEQVALCMGMVKVSRLLNSPDHRDSLVDLCGYAKTYHLVRERRKA